MKKRLWIMRMAARNLSRNHRRNLTIGFAIALSFAGILLFGGFVVWVEKTLRVSTVYVNQTGHLTLARPGALESQLTNPRKALMSAEEKNKVMAILERDGRIERVGKGLGSFAMLSKNCRNRGVILLGRDTGVDRSNLDRSEVLRWAGQLIYPEHQGQLSAFRASQRPELPLFPAPPVRDFLSSEESSSSDEACQSQEAGHLTLMGWDLRGRIAASDGFVIGEQSTGLALLDERAMYLPIEDLQKLLDTDRVGSLHVFLNSVTSLPLVWKDLNEELAKAGLNLEILPFFDDQVGLYYIGSLSFVGAIGCFFVTLISLVVGLTLLSLFTMSVTERSSEIGLLLSLGFPETLVEKIFTTENLFLTLMSLVVGGVSAFGIGSAIYAANIRFAAAGAAGDTRLMIAWEPWVVLLLSSLFFLVIYFCIRTVVRHKFKKTLVQLLQEASTL